MTKTKQMIYKRAAKKACKENGMNIPMTNMVLLESGTCGAGIVDYVMFEDHKTGRQFQCGWHASNYTIDHPSFWLVTEYID